MERSNKRSC